MVKRNEHSLYNNHTLPELKYAPKMILKVVRDIYNEHATLGKLYIDGAFFAYTLEDKYRAQRGDASKKVKNATCIDDGSYKVILSLSTRFKRILPELLSVPCFDKIRIHGGNTEADTEGCILIGAWTDGAKVAQCKPKVDELVARMQGKDVTIIVERATVAV